jgi:hypothetical protein
MSATSSVKYGIYEGSPYRFNGDEAWVYHEGKWHPDHPAGVNTYGHLMTPEAFADAFGELPALPADAFSSTG